MKERGQLQVPAALFPGKDAGFHPIKDWVGLETEKICFPAAIRTPNRPDRSVVTVPIALSHHHFSLCSYPISFSFTVRYIR